MATPVYQLFAHNPDSGVTAVLSDLLRIDLPAGVPDAVAAVGLEVTSERASDIHRMTRRGRVLSRGELADLLGEALVNYGWFFVGLPGQPGDPIASLSVLDSLPRCAFVVDILEGRHLGVRTTLPSMIEAARQVIVGAGNPEVCDLTEVKLMY